MKQKLYALDAFFIEKLKLSENDPDTKWIPRGNVSRSAEPIQKESSMIIPLNYDIIPGLCDPKRRGKKYYTNI